MDRKFLAIHSRTVWTRSFSNPKGLRFQGVYQVTVTSIGNDSELLGFAPTDSLTTEFLYETTVPTAAVTSDGGETELTDKALPLEGTASDPSGTQRVEDR